MKITLKTVILVALFIFYLVIILSNFTTYEGMETNSSEAADESHNSDLDSAVPIELESKDVSPKKPVSTKPVSKTTDSKDDKPKTQTNLVKTVLQPVKPTEPSKKDKENQ